ncbi:MAG: hypoxanthine-guanine phosphoribosyltransferase [Gammaproteobacteria bacterium]|nr:hypoxanthine-guanine phosphoribosyltransferase [Gammaproteobacteria bacterium]
MNELKDIQQVWDDADLLCSDAEVKTALDNMAQVITERLGDANPVCLCVMTGGIIPVGQLLPRLHFPLQLDYVHATRYRDKTQGSDLHWKKYPACDMNGRSVLVIDDILDEGLTLTPIIEYCRSKGAREVLSAVLVDKQRERSPGGLKQADITGLHVANRYVFGYGLDYKGYLRNAAGIYAVKGL